MKYKIVLGVIGTLVTFQGTMATRDVGGKAQLLDRKVCSNCHEVGGRGRALAHEESIAGAPLDETHFSKEELGRLRVDRAADDVYRTDMADPEPAAGILRNKERQGYRL